MAKYSKGGCKKVERAMKEKKASTLKSDCSGKKRDSLVYRSKNTVPFCIFSGSPSN